MWLRTAAVFGQQRKEDREPTLIIATIRARLYPRLSTKTMSQQGREVQLFLNDPCRRAMRLHEEKYQAHQ